MKNLMLSIGGLVFGFTLGYFSKPTYEDPAHDQKYGVLRVPIPTNCPDVIGQVSDS